MQRRLRVCRLLPPRKCLGAHSSRSALLLARLAVMAAHSAALPPPNTKTSYIRETSIGFPFAIGRIAIGSASIAANATVLYCLLMLASLHETRSLAPGSTRVFEAGRYLLALFSDQVRSAASVFSTCLLGFRLM